MITPDKIFLTYLKDFLNLDLKNNNNEIIQVNNIQIPNFYKFPLLFVNDQNQIKLKDDSFEFLHQLYKLFNHEYINKQITFYESDFKTISEKDIIFDCGSNMGLFAAYAASKGAKVYCFEPSTYIRHYLKATQQIYPNNIFIIPYAVSNKNEITKLQQYSSSGNSRLINISIPSPQNLLYYDTIQTVTLDSFCKQYNIIPTFIKMDIENYEEYALEGAKNIINKYKPVLSIAVHETTFNKNNLLTKIDPTYSHISKSLDNCGTVFIGASNDKI